jgi:hypothetical protein
VLELWYDNPLPDAGDGPLAKRNREDLQDVHWSVTLTRIKTAVSLGGHREVTAELRRLLKDRPSEGVIPMLLATALYRCDRIPEAAKVCERAIAAREGQGIEAAAADGPPGLVSRMRVSGRRRRRYWRNVLRQIWWTSVPIWSFACCPSRRSCASRWAASP